MSRFSTFTSPIALTDRCHEGMALPRRAGWRRLVPFAVLAVIFAAIPLVWPGDAPWINDEPTFVRLAVESNATGKLATEALMGHRGVAYGPMAIWLYAGALRVVHDLVGLVFVHVLVMTAVTALALAWIGSLSYRLDASAGALALLSPYLWFYDRLLWDNTFLIPLSAISLAAYVAFSVSPKPWTLWVAALGCISMALIHLMCAPLILAIAFHAAWFHRPWLRRHWGAALLAGAVSLLIASPYLARLAIDTFATPAAVAPFPADRAVDTLQGAKGYDWGGWTFPWLGGRVFCGFGIDYFFGKHWWISHAVRGGAWVRAASLVSCVAIGFVWIGLARAVASLRTEGAARGADFHLAWVCVVAFGFQCVLDGIAQITEHPHYYNGIWICYFYFIWKALSDWPGGRVGCWLKNVTTGGYAVSLAVVIGFLVVSVHATGGNRDIHYGATLKNQIEIAKQLGDYAPDSPLHVNVRNYQLYPHALLELREFYGFWGTPTAPRRSLTIRYLREQGTDGWLTLEVSAL